MTHVALIFATVGCLVSAEPLTLENVVPPGPNRPDEPLRDEYSFQAGVRFLDTAALSWQKQRKCFSCHSNYAYLFTRPAVSWHLPAHQQLRAKLEHLAEFPRDVRYKVTETVMVASVLAQNDALTTGHLHPATRQALDRMWSFQREDGGFSWLDENEPPSEIDDHYGVTMAAIGVGVAPDDYAKTPAAQRGLEKIRAYLRNNRPANMHHRAMKLIASRHVDGIFGESDRAQVVDDLLALQQADGGWGLATLGNWNREDGTPQDMLASDGYGTGFVIYVLRNAGVAADHPQIQKGIDWLKTHQRASGRWFTRSMNRDNKHFITHSGTAYAVLALALCGEADSGDVAEPEDGFVPIFDGKTLDGWAGLNGDTSSYYVKDGMLVCKPDGKVHIFTDQQYDNFILRLQIKMDPGGNNGIGIRAQRSHTPHLNGMELQVLDDDYYADGDPIRLKNYQHHGSIYGVVPARTGHLKRAGQWNDQEILCDGRRLRVTLNGTVIVDADLDKVLPIDGNQHPGLKHEKGHIGLHAHGNYGAEVFFRNMRLKQLP